MRILGIETSCDDTGVSIIEARGKRNPSFRILANVVASQIKVHQKYGGVYPNLARREHETNLPIAVAKALKQTKLNPLRPKLDALAITYGPGLSPCLWTGLNETQKLTKQWNIPVIPVNHMEGHLLISLFSQRDKNDTLHIPNAKTTFPAVALLVSGGHTQLILVSALGKYKLLGETRDDAAGECFDKTARILGLPYPGGPAIAKLAALPKPGLGTLPKPGLGITLPRPMISTKDYDFSFSGLKTAVLYDWKARSKKVRESAQYVQTMAQAIQQAIVDVLVSKTLRAAQEWNARSIILGGGVAANKELRKQLGQKILNTKYQILVAPPALCTDNGAMIAVAGYATWLRRGFKKHNRIEAKPNVSL